MSYRSRSPSSLRSLLRQKSLSGSTASLGAASTSTTSTIIHPGAQDTTDMSPEHLCLETLRIAVSYWEDADPSTASLQHRLEHLLELAYHMQDSYEREVVRATDHMMFDTAINAFTETESLARSRTVSRCSSSDSFVSATDLADLSDLERHQDMFHHLALYEAGVLELKHGSVSCRTLRLAMQEIFRVQEHRDYFTEMGRQVISSLLLQAEKDADDFHTAFNTMMAFINNADNWSKMEEELRGRGALSTAVWSVLKAKRRMLKFPDGFIGHFYNVSESVSPVLAWGFLGPESKLKDICFYFKEVVLGFIQDMFSFEKARYTTVDDLASDIVRLAKTRIDQVLQKLNADPT
ncbi:MIGA-like protein [Mya arenaria]|uniref:MIGA-like protein n=1 Tax=Mya arenaria TaxID=6604 RepID=A0ABY7GDT8_MYAAR|nr:MIGA-like protein [Mya arenaria]